MRGDILHFRDLTMGHAMIMGRKTLDSIGIALPGRKTVVCSRNETCDIPGIETANSLEEAYSISKQSSDGEIFIVGGGEIYRQALPDVQKIYATEVDAVIPGADTYFPELDNSWVKTSEQRFPSDDKNIYPYSFVTFERR